ncbi:MAG: pyrroline-5-carboxylate reductase [Gemmatales bacterium]|nr:pyrroline-5-carboxylate reductase [Gemmatales bacterium]MDW7994995.1 pyrroline-5-carboxylate reductase [Gemmatales bacterium]
MTTVFPRLGIIGAGRMGGALLRGVLAAGVTTPDAVCFSCARAESRQRLAQQTRARALADNAQVVAESEAVVLAVKPQVAGAVLREIAPVWTRDRLLISVVAGLRLASLEGMLGGSARLVRAMPNTPCLVGAGITAYCTNAQVRAEDVQVVERLFGAVGDCLAVQEAWLDAVTGLSGSGPAYVAVFVEALTDGGVQVGLPREVAYRLALQTVKGTVALLQQTGQHPAQLKDMVASPGGTTMAGLHALEQGAFRAAVMNAVVAATARAQQLGQLPETK